MVAVPEVSQEPKRRDEDEDEVAPCLEYTRDLFLCARFVARRRPGAGEDLACALVAAVHGRAVWKRSVKFLGERARASDEELTSRQRPAATDFAQIFFCKTPMSCERPSVA